MIRGSPDPDDRAVSVAVNHVLAIAITTILITTLLYGAGNVLDRQDDRATHNQLRTIGDRLANQVTTAEAVAKRNGGSAVVQTDHPRRIVGDSYRIELVDGADCGYSTTGCLRLSTVGGDTEVTTPVRVDDIEESSVSGGPIAIVYDEDGARLVASPSDANPGVGAPVPDDDDPAVAPIGGAVGQTRTQWGANDNAPSVTIDDVTITSCSGSNAEEVEVEFTPDDPDYDLSAGTIRVNESGGSELNSTSVDLTGSEDTTRTETLNISTNDDLDIEVIVEDENGNTDTATTTEVNGCT